jgi:hypothetical protein
VTVVDVWLVPVVAGAANDPALCSLLGAGERDAVASLGFAADRDRAVTARAAARRELGHRLGVHPRHVPLVIRGRAVVAGADVGVSWSHSGTWVALALAADRAVGIDIEAVPRLVPYEALALMGARSVEDFVAAEAAGKATGRGLVSPTSADLRVCRLSAPAGYLAAVAAPGDDWSVDLHGSTHPAGTTIPAAWWCVAPSTATGAFWVLPTAPSRAG